MNWRQALAVFLIVAAALALRLPNLSRRPLHNDEAVNAIKAAELWEQGRYRYDPDEYHRRLHYATLPFLWLSGARDANELPDAVLRIAPVVFGIGLLFLLFLFRGGLSPPALLWAALFAAISPAMVFYSRYFIHEMPLVFFTALLLGAGWKYFDAPMAADGARGATRPTLWAIVAGGAMGLMFATKETFVITILAIICAFVATSIWHPSVRSWSAALLRRSGFARDLTLCCVAFLLVWLLFFSSVFTNFSGLADSIRTYFPWLKRAGGHSPHIHTWSFYLERLAWFHPAKSPVWTEALILILALVGGIGALKRRASGLHIFLAFYTFAQTAAYTIIPYKTPWCLLNFWLGAILLAGLGAADLVSRFRIPAAALIAVAAAQLTHQSYRANFVFFADRKNPYVYAQTLPDLVAMTRKIEAIASVSANGHNTPIKVITGDGDYWPLPWYLRRFKTVGWFDKMPDDPFAPIVIVSQKLEAALDERSDKKWIMVGYSELRPQRFLELYVELELWKQYVAAHPPAPDAE